MTSGLRRVIFALAIAAPSMLAIALLTKIVGGPEWVIFTLVCVSMCALGVVLIIADGFACICEAKASEGYACTCESKTDEYEMTYSGGPAWKP